MEFTKRFYKEKNGGWFIDLPEFKGSKAELAMVAGADTMLDILSQGEPEVHVRFSNKPFNGSSLLNKVKEGKEEGGAHYMCKKIKGMTYNLPVWLCDVTKFVFGSMPDKIYYR